jgi:hypothetical protein
MERLHVDDQLTAMVCDDEDTNAATTALEGFGKTGPQVGLVDDGNVLLDITSLGHGNDNTILEIENTILLEDGAEHGLDNNARAGVGNEWRLLMQLLGEEINTQVSVLACGRRGGDTDDLAWTTLEDQEIAETDVMAGDSDGVGGVGGLSGGGGGASTARYELGSVSSTSYGNVNLFPLNRVMIVMMMMRTT